MNNIELGEYVTNPATRTVHVRSSIPLFHPFTRCGKRIRPGWELGDETFCGIAATCARCRELQYSRR